MYWTIGVSEDGLRPIGAFVLVIATNYDRSKDCGVGKIVSMLLPRLPML